MKPVKTPKSETKQKTKYLDAGLSLNQITESTIYVTCPQCKQCASMIYELKRLSCLNCAFIKIINERNWWNEVHRHSLWLQTNFQGRTIWAYNEEHLSILESYISAELRTRTYPVKSNGWSNKSLVSRLPRWMTTSSNRESILKALASLRQKLINCNSKTV